MSKLPSIQFYPGDYLRDAVAGCSLAAQGLWLRMLIQMHDSERYGFLCVNGAPMSPDSIARRAGAGIEEYRTLLAELDAAGVPRRTSDGIIFNKRMVSDEAERAKDRERKRLEREGGKAKAPASAPSPKDVRTLSADCPDVVPRSSSSSSSSSSPSGLGVEALPPLPPDIDTPEVRVSWAAYVASRNAMPKAKRMTVGAAEACYRKFSGHSPATCVKALDDAVAGAYQGVFPERFANATQAHRGGFAKPDRTAAADARREAERKDEFANVQLRSVTYATPKKFPAVATTPGPRPAGAGVQGTLQPEARNAS